jgi:selenophosphate synthase
MLCDAQTSGGLLVAIPPENAGSFEAALAAAPYPAARIGVMRGDGVIRLEG